MKDISRRHLLRARATCCQSNMSRAKKAIAPVRELRLLTSVSLSGNAKVGTARGFRLAKNAYHHQRVHLPLADKRATKVRNPAPVSQGQSENQNTIRIHTESILIQISPLGRKRRSCFVLEALSELGAQPAKSVLAVVALRSRENPALQRAPH